MFYLGACKVVVAGCCLLFFCLSIVTVYFKIYKLFFGTCKKLITNLKSQIKNLANREALKC